MALKALLPLFCLCLFAFSASSRPAFQAVSKFDASELLGVKWYEFFDVNNLITELYACTRVVYTSIGNGKLAIQYGRYVPGLNGAFDSALLIVKQLGKTGQFQFYDNNTPTDQYAYILDFDPCYEWIVFAVDFQGDLGDVILVISKSPQNLVALQRGIDLAEYYDMDSHHLVLQTPKCDYNNIFYQLKKQRNNL